MLQGVVSRMRWSVIYVGFALGRSVVDIVLSHLPALVPLFTAGHDLFSHICWKKEGRVQTSVSSSAPPPHLLHHSMADLWPLAKNSKVFVGHRGVGGFFFLRENPVCFIKRVRRPGVFKVFFSSLVLMHVDVRL